jgi:hypothetical protein
MNCNIYNNEIIRDMYRSTWSLYVLAPLVDFLGFWMNPALMWTTTCSLVGGQPEPLPWQIQPFIMKLSYHHVIDLFESGFSPNFVWNWCWSLATDFYLWNQRTHSAFCVAFHTKAMLKWPGNEMPYMVVNLKSQVTSLLQQLWFINYKKL